MKYTEQIYEAINMLETSLYLKVINPKYYWLSSYLDIKMQFLQSFYQCFLIAWHKSFKMGVDTTTNDRT